MAMKQMDGLRRGIREWKAIEELPDDRKTAIMEFFEKDFTFEPRKQEARILVQIEEQVERYTDNLFSYADAALEGFFASVRDTTGSDDYTKLSNEELEQAILALQKTIYRASVEVSRLYSEVFLANKIQEDEYAEEYRKPMDGTKDDRHSAAIRNTKDSRWRYLGSYMIYKRLADKLDALKELKKTLEFHQSRVQKENRGWY